jgi:hypothetical protein
LSAKTVAVVVLFVALAGVSTLAWEHYQELVALRARTVGGDERVALQATLADLERRNRELEAQLAALRGKGGATDATTANDDAAEAPKRAAALLATLAGSDDAALTGESRRDAELELLGAMADLPEFQQLIALQQRAKIDAKYAALFKKLHLTPDQQQKLETLLADRQSAFADAMIAAHDQGLTGKDARNMATTVARATQKEIDSSLKTMLGAQGYNQYQNYERTMPQRDTVTQLAQRLSYSSTPLSPGQQEQLVQTLATTVNPKPPAGAAGTAKPVRQPTTVAPLPGSLSGLGIASSTTAVISPTAVAKAQTFLSTQQVNALRQMQQEQQAQQALTRLLHTGMGAKAPAPKPGKG